MRSARVEVVEYARPAAAKFDAEVVEKKLRCVDQKSFDVVENERPFAVKKFAEEVENVPSFP